MLFLKLTEKFNESFAREVREIKELTEGGYTLPSLFSPTEDQMFPERAWGDFSLDWGGRGGGSNLDIPNY